MELTRDELLRIEIMLRSDRANFHPTLENKNEAHDDAQDAQEDHDRAAQEAQDDHDRAAQEAQDDHDQAAQEAQDDHDNAAAHDQAHDDAQDAQEDHDRAAQEAQDDHDRAAQEAQDDHDNAAAHDQANEDDAGGLVTARIDTTGSRARTELAPKSNSMGELVRARARIVGG